MPAPSSPSRDNWVLCDGRVCVAQAPAPSEGGGRAGLGETPHVAATQLGSEWPADESDARAPGSLGRTNNPTLKIGRGKSPLSRFLTPVADAFPLNLLCAFAMCVFQVAPCLDASWRVARTFECANHRVCLRGAGAVSQCGHRCLVCPRSLKRGPAVCVSGPRRPLPAWALSRGQASTQRARGQSLWVEGALGGLRSPRAMLPARGSSGGHVPARVALPPQTACRARVHTWCSSHPLSQSVRRHLDFPMGRSHG